MLNKTEIKTITDSFSLLPFPEEALSYGELQGYMFGLSMTPDIILPSEWMPLIYGGTIPEFLSTEQASDVQKVLTKLYNCYVADFLDKKLELPFDIQNLDDDGLDELYEWVSGFEEALWLREEIWDPEEYSNLNERRAQELYHAMMTIQGLVDPDDVYDFFANLPEEAFLEAFPQMDVSNQSKELQIQLFLIASLPLAVKTLIEHSRSIEKKNKKSEAQKNKKAEVKTRKGKSNVIQVDFSKKKK